MKLGVKNADPILASAINAIVVLVISWTVVFANGTQTQLLEIDSRTLVFLVLSGLATGGVGIANYGALKIGDVDTYVGVVRCSMVLTVILSFVILGDPLTRTSGIGAVFVLVGTVLMIDRRSRTSGEPVSKRWIALMVVAIALSSTATLLGKVGISDIDSNLGTAMFALSIVVLANGLALTTGKWHQAKDLSRRELLVILLSGVFYAGMELTFYAGLKLQLTSIVMPVDKLLSGLITVIMAYMVFGEKVNKRAATALCLIAVGSFLIMM